ncbi:acyltransferase 3 [Bisporella sp. PMI_857]|nr:acyltransferase 3 [Bisporella sp. PMI_857]
MASTAPRSSVDEKRVGQKNSIDLEAQVKPADAPVTSPQQPLLHRFISYPAPNSLKLRPTAWLDGVRGIAALEVYIFHATGCWANIVWAWHSSPDQTNLLQLPLIRTFFVSGGAAVSVFFVLSGYVLTHKSLKWIREGQAQLVYPALWSSMFRRGFRLYLPPMLLTFCEMIATRFGYAPPLNFSFTPEPTAWMQFGDWLQETNALINPFYNLSRAVHGFVTHPKYDSVIWTIPLEYWGSFVCYILLLTLAKLPSHGTRMFLVGAFALLSLSQGSWNFFCFAGGMLVADFNISQDANPSPTPLSRRHKYFYTILLSIAIYIAGLPTMVYPNAKLKPMPGFQFLRSLTPMSLNMEDHSRFFWSISGLSILLCVSQLPNLKAKFESRFCQYLGRISFSMYLIHNFCNILFGLAVKDWMMRITGLNETMKGHLSYWILCVIWFSWFTVMVFAIAAQVERWVDVPSVKFARWLEGKCLKGYKNFR